MPYHPRPLEPPRLEAEFRARSLADPQLRAFAAERLGAARPWPPRELDLEALSLVALFYHPDLGVAAARARTYEAGRRAAGVRPNPTLAAGAGGSNSPESPVVFRFEPALLIETARKRDYRILEAEKLAEAAGLEIVETRWRVRSRVRAALVEHLFAARLADSLGAEAEARAESVTMLETRLARGEISRPVVEAVRAGLSSARVAIKAAQGRAAEALAALAAAAGLPVAALDGTPIVWREAEQPAALGSLPLKQAQAAGLLHRADVRRTLVEYAAAEARLRLEIARQYPDIEIGPGYSFDEGHYKITLGGLVSLPLFNRNRGPIAEAEARRGEIEARLLALQARVIAEVESAHARYRAALEETLEAGALLEAARRGEQAARRAFEAGEEDRLALAGARVQAAVLARARLEALRKAQSALGALEDAVQREFREANP